MIYTAIELPSDEPVRYVGVYVLNWRHKFEPEVGFREPTREELEEALRRLDEYEKERE